MKITIWIGAENNYRQYSTMRVHLRSIKKEEIWE
jgi:hypothetical protein